MKKKTQDGCRRPLPDAEIKSDHINNINISRKADRTGEKAHAGRGHGCRFVLLFLLAAAAALLLAACSAQSEYYTDKNAVEYVRQVHGSEYSLTGSSYTTDSDGRVVYQYNFSNGGEETFSVYAKWADSTDETDHRTFYDTYNDALIGAYQDEIEQAMSDSGLDARLESDDQPDGYGSEYTMSVYLDSTDQFQSVAELIAQIDSIVTYTYQDNETDYNVESADDKNVVIYLQPDNRVSGDTADSWKDSDLRGNYIISTVPLDNGEGEMAESSEIQDTIYNDYVDYGKYAGRSLYTLTEDEWNMYPAPWLQVTSIGGHNVSGSMAYRFLYDRASGEYWMSYLDLCQDFDGFPYDYERKGAFAGMVNDLYGSYKCDNWKAIWQIGTSEWQAQLKVKKTKESAYSFGSITISRDGKAIDLDPTPESGDNGTVSGRKYSMKDLIQMLDVTITVNQQDMTAVIDS